MKRILLVTLVGATFAAGCARGTARPTLEVEGYETHVWTGKQAPEPPAAATPGAPVERAETSPPVPSSPEAAPATPADTPTTPSAPRRGWERAKPW